MGKTIGLPRKWSGRESTAVAVDLEKSVFRFAVADYLTDLGIEAKLPPVKQVRRSVRRNRTSGFDTLLATRVDVASWSASNGLCNRPCSNQLSGFR